MENIIFIGDNQYQLSFQADFSSIQLIDEKYSIYLIKQNMCKVQLSDGKFSIISTIQNVYENISDVIEFYEISVIFVQIQIVGDSFASLTKNHTYFQYLNFLWVYNSYYELKYNPQQCKIQVKATIGSIVDINFKFFNDFRFYKVFTYFVRDISSSLTYLNSVQIMYNMIPGCSQSGQLLSCSSCQPYYYLKNGQCVPSSSDHYFVQPIQFIFIFVKEDKTVKNAIKHA
ncbi:hypothetical protein TTHERM_00631780 (macronuclear) [Tetrahymena thermophila SB210]|uniref:Uncharacterized protein n=1 Tax=Tetrahymena thermophila (strain SB210) TaxID=312017 RepID=Q241L1_TETTS|nr:hypothetical protein TTHERM_00631780 [Tetrahymena thermophila SB210]EAS02559.2 hypothetical protein TTHERM_00631780 [Tetrahymena thermophila SB210]|eukprot:XP_001022804.2 hypothetical protein TTHERM_00631780 [Tetrahymena thermophila SB210]